MATFPPFKTSIFVSIIAEATFRLAVSTRRPNVARDMPMRSAAES
jgi:hypothetical protein